MKKIISKKFSLTKFNFLDNIYKQNEPSRNKRRINIKQKERGNSVKLKSN